MPSWNIHTAHIEGLLKAESPSSLGIRDVDSFLFGNLVPDIYVGYMVPDVSRKIPYRETHLADPGFIPLPDAGGFYKRYVVGAGRQEDDVVLGAWTHLLADHYYNLRTTEYIATIGVLPGEQTRIRKQGDFDLFGRTLSIRRVPEPSSRLLQACAAFPQYAIEEKDVRGALSSMQGIVVRNRAEHMDETPTYTLLTPEFFAQTYAEVDTVLSEALHVHAKGGDPSYLGVPPQGHDGSPVGTERSHG